MSNPFIHCTLFLNRHQGILSNTFLDSLPTTVVMLMALPFFSHHIIIIITLCLFCSQSQINYLNVRLFFFAALICVRTAQEEMRSSGNDHCVPTMVSDPKGEDHPKMRCTTIRRGHVNPILTGCLK